MALSDSEFFILNKLATAGWRDISNHAPYLITRLEGLGYLETNRLRTHANITKAGKAAHHDAHILRGRGEALPIRGWGE